MNIQIFGTSKCFDTKKAQRYFKERGIKFQMIDLKEKEMSRGEFENVARALGGWEQLVNPAAADAGPAGCTGGLAEGGQAVRESAALQNAHRAQRQKGHRGLPARDLENVGINRAFTKNPRPGFCTGGQFVVY